MQSTTAAANSTLNNTAKQQVRSCTLHVRSNAKQSYMNTCIFAVVSTFTLVGPDVVVAASATMSFTACVAAVDDAGVALVGTGATMGELLGFSDLLVEALALLLDFALVALVAGVAFSTTAFLVLDEPPVTCNTAV
eukprot:20408-Heterococcus_DN1.PRE.2